MVKRKGGRQGIPGKDPDIPGVVGGAGSSLGGRNIDGGYGVMARITARIGVGVELPDKGDIQRRLFQRLADRGLLQGFAPIDEPTRNGPAVGGIFALYENDSPVNLDDDVHGGKGIARFHRDMLSRGQGGVKEFYCLTDYPGRWYSKKIMAPYIGIFATSFLLALSGAIMPGPLLTVTINESITRGARTGPLLIIGHAILELVFIVIILWGLGSILRNDLFLSIIAFGGSAVLLWMGWSMTRSIRTLKLSDASVQTKNGTIDRILKHPISAGIIVSLANPYWVVWWLTIGLAYIFISAKLGTAGVIVFFVGHILADFLWYTAVSMSISLGKRFFTDGVYRGIVAFCAVFLFGFSVYFFKSGFDYLLK
jgi:threonine/homoserine/homoserine lactone efflux protein